MGLLILLWPRYLDGILVLDLISKLSCFKNINKSSMWIWDVVREAPTLHTFWWGGPLSCLVSFRCAHCIGAPVSITAPSLTF